MSAAAGDALSSGRASGTAPVGLAVAAVALVAGAILAVLAFQAVGYAPCELCLKERIPYYAGLPIGLATVAAALSGRSRMAGLCFLAMGALFLFSAGFGAYHAGVEWGFWAGPTDCTGAPSRAATNADFLRQLATVKVVRCDAAALRILGLSLAGWNAVASACIAILSVLGWRATSAEA